MIRGPTISNTWYFFSTDSSQSVGCDRKKRFMFRGNNIGKLDENNSNQQVHTAVQQYIQYTILCSHVAPNSVLQAESVYTTFNSMFARLGTDYEIRNQWFFAILKAITTD